MFAKLLCAAFAASLAFVASENKVFAQEWPAKTVRIVVPFGPIGFVDAVGRLIADELSRDLDKPFIVENRAGAGGAVGAAQVARALPDGYTLLLGGLATNIMSPAINSNVTFDGLKDFAFVSFIGGPPIAWVVPVSSNLHTVKDLIDEARRDQIAGYASSGVGTLGHVVVASVLRQAGVKIPHVPMNQASTMDIVAGRVPLGSLAYGSVLGQVQGGAVRMIAVSSEERVSAFPDVPTIKESGFDIAAVSWLALAAPAGTPQEVRDRLHAALIKVIAKPNVAERLSTEGIRPQPMSQSELLSFVEREATQWAPAARQAVAGK